MSSSTPKSKGTSNVQRRRSPRLKAKEEEARKRDEPEEGDDSSKNNTAKPNWKRKLLIRCSVGLVMILGFFALTYSHHWVVGGFVVIAQLMSFRELTAVRYSEAKEKEIPMFRLLNWSALGVALWVAYGKRVLVATNLLTVVPYHLAISFTGFVLLFTTFVLSLKKGFYKYQMTQLAWSMLVILLIVGQGIGSLWNLFQGLIWFMLPASLIVCNDIMAYFCGLAFGRKFVQRQFLALSPNKTWEGFIGGFISTLIFCPIFVYVYTQLDFWVCPTNIMNDAFECARPAIFSVQDVNLFGYYSLRIAPIYLHGWVLAIFASLIAPFGGFFASGVKRAFGKKDFDSLFPGHGGVVDRIDCQMILQLFTYVYIRTWVITGPMNVPRIIQEIAALTTNEQQVVLAALQEMLN